MPIPSGVVGRVDAGVRVTGCHVAIVVIERHNDVSGSHAGHVGLLVDRKTGASTGEIRKRQVYAVVVITKLDFPSGRNGHVSSGRCP